MDQRVISDALFDCEDDPRCKLLKLSRRSPRPIGHPRGRDRGGTRHGTLRMFGRWRHLHPTRRRFCHYVEEDAIMPLWKGQRFP